MQPILAPKTALILLITFVTFANNGASVPSAKPDESSAGDKIKDLDVRSEDILNLHCVKGSTVCKAGLLPASHNLG